jgi:hypothetical protein
MVQKQDKPASHPGVFSTLAAGFELTTRYLWLMVIPAALDLFLWIGPRLSFRPLIQTLAAQLPSAAQLPPEAMLIDPAPLLETFATRLNHFTYLSVSLLGVPALMTGLTPEETPIQPLIIERAGWGEWFGYLALLTLGGLLLSAVYYTLIAYALRRASAVVPGAAPPLSAGRFIGRVGRTWLRLVGLAALLLIVALVIFFPASLVAGLLSLISQGLAIVALMGALILLIWIVMFLSYTPQGATLNPRGFWSSLGDSVRLFRLNLPASLWLLFLVALVRRALSLILLSADTGTWVTGINLLAHAYISTALLVALFLFYRDRYATLTQPPATPPIHVDQT